MQNSIDHNFQNTKVNTNVLMRNVYWWMTAGLFMTAIVANAVSSNLALLQMLNTGFTPILLLVAMFVMVWQLSGKIMSLKAGTAVLLFSVFSCLMGASLAPILLIYTGASLAQTFFTTAALFLSMSIYGSITKRDLNKFGTYLIFGIFGIIIANLLNAFIFRSTGLDLLISSAGVVIFLGLTAYDTQKIIRISNQVDLSDNTNFMRISILGALTLYLDFINLFLFLLRILGRRN